MNWTQQRKYPRTAVDLPAEITEGDTVRQTRILTLGGGGLFLEASEPMFVGTALSIRFRPAESLPIFVANATVRYQIPHRGIGVEFTEIDPALWQELIEHIFRRINVPPNSPFRSRPYPWTEQWINFKAPPADGVYAILERDGGVLYIGKGNIRDRLFGHWRRENPVDEDVQKDNPATYVFEVCGDPAKRLAEVLREFTPKFPDPSR